MTRMNEGDERQERVDTAAREILCAVIIQDDPRLGVIEDAAILAYKWADALECERASYIARRTKNLDLLQRASASKDSSPT